MRLNSPANSEEAAYISFELVTELIDLLVAKRILDPSDPDHLIETVANRLSQSSSNTARRAAQFIHSGTKE
jgi:hypothetical protein